MHFSFQRASSLALGKCALATLGLAALVPTTAQAQTQDLFVTDAVAGTVSRFAGTGPGTFSTTAMTVASGLGTPRGLAFDARGDLFVANNGPGRADQNGNGTVMEFATTGGGALGAGTTFASGLIVPEGVAFDALGDLFVSNNDDFRSPSITEFPSTGPGTFGPGTGGGEFLNPTGLAFDARGDLFAASSVGYIEEFPSTGAGRLGAGMFLPGIGLSAPEGLAFDARGDLFVANSGFGNIVEFVSTGVGTFGPVTTFASGLNPAGLAFDALGDLFATNGTTITEFVSTGGGTLGAGTVVETGLSGPFGLAFGPSASAPVPEASTVVSLGLLLALGMGGVAIAARKKRGA